MTVLALVALAVLVLAGCKSKPELGTVATGPLFDRAGSPLAAVFPLRLVDHPQQAWARIPADAMKAHASEAESRFALVPVEYTPLVKNIALGKQDGTLDLMKALFAPVPSRWSFELDVPAGATLDLGMAVMPSGDGKGTAGARFLVEVGEPGADGQALLDVSARQGDGRWVRRSVDLSSVAGKRVRLTLRTDGDAGAPAAWGNPIVRAGGTSRKGPNVILFAMDTVRRDRLSLYGFERPVSPNIDALGARGTVFDQAVANANWSRPSYYSLFTGKMPGNLGVPVNRFNISAEETDYFYKHNKLTLPFLLKEAGYRSVAIGNNYFIVQGRTRDGVGQLGLDVGFEEVVNIDGPKGTDVPLIVDETRKFLAAHKDQPFFLFVSFDNAHFPYDPPDAFRKKWTTCDGCSDTEEFRYLGGIAVEDDGMGEILREVERQGLADDTVVILFADHGENFDPAHDYRYPRRGLGAVEWTRTLFDHGSSLFDEVLRVPLVLAGPGVAMRRVDRQVELLDVMPTILDLTGADRKGVAVDGTSLVPFLKGQDAPGTPAVVSEGMDIRSLRTVDWHYIFAEDIARKIRKNVDGKEVELDQKELLFDLKADPLEHRNLVAERIEDLSRMRRLLDQRWNEKLYGLHVVVAGEAGARHEYSGEVRTTNGVFTRVGPFGTEDGDALDVAMDRKKFTFSGSLEGDRDGVVFQVSPPDAPVTVDLKVDGKPVAREATAMGCLGMRFPAVPVKFADAKARRNAVCDQPPKVEAQTGPVALFWETVEPFLQKGEQLDAGMKRMLKDWGYIHEEGNDAKK